MGYTTDELIARLNIYGAVPSSQPAYSQIDILNLMNEEMMNIVVPFIKTLNEDYFIRYSDLTLPYSADKLYTAYIPRKAIGNMLKEVHVLNGNNGYSLPRVSANRYFNFNIGYFIQDDALKLLNPSSYNNCVLRMYYYRRPNTLVLSSAARQITNISGNDITVATVPTTWIVGTNIDFIQNCSPFGVVQEDSAITQINSNVITFSSIDNRIVIGDWLNISGQSNIPNIPPEVHGLLTQSTVMRILEAQGDDKGLDVASIKYKQLQENVRNLLTPRVTAAAKKIVSSESLQDGKWNKIFF